MAATDFAFSAGWEEPGTSPRLPAPQLVEETRVPPRVQGPAGGSPASRRSGPASASPLQLGTGACPVPGCRQPGAHIHRPDPLTGRRPSEVDRRRREAGEWTVIDWRVQIANARWSEARALAALRQAVANEAAETGQPLVLPERLADVPRRPHLVRLMLDVLDTPPNLRGTR